MIATRVADYPISEKQAEFRQCNSNVKGFCAGRGSGKTKIGCVDRILSAKGGSEHMVVSPTYGDIEETTLREFRRTAEEIGAWVKYVKSPRHRVVIRTQDGGRAEFVFVSGDEPERLRGPNKASLWLDEASVMSQDVFKIGRAMLRRRNPLTGMVDLGQLVLTFTPKGRRHWTCGLFYDIDDDGDLTAKPGRTCFHAATYDNPWLDPSYYKEMRKDYTSHFAEGELHGAFVDVEGLLFMRSWFPGLVSRDTIPARSHRVRYWDKAGTAVAENPAASYTAGVLMALSPDGIYYIEDVVHGQWSPEERDKTIYMTAELDAEKYGNQVYIWFEQEPGSGGKESALGTIRKLSKFPVYRDVITGGRVRKKDQMRLPGEAKIVRAQPFAAQCEAGNVRICRDSEARRWNGKFLDEMTAFPEYAFSDQVDATSGAHQKLQKFKGIPTEAPERIANPIPESGKWGVHVVRRLRPRMERFGRM